MKRIAVLAILAFVMAMVPATTASSQLDGVGTVHIANSTANTYDIFYSVNGATFDKLNDFGGVSRQEILMPVGTRTIVVCQPTSGEAGCTAALTVATVTFELGENDQQNAYIYQSTATTFEIRVFNEDTDPTDIDESRLTFHNLENPALTVLNLQLDVCVRGEHVIGPVLYLGTGSADVESGQEVDTLIYVLPAGTFTTCGQAGAGNAADPVLDLAPGTNQVTGLQTNATCTSACTKVLIVGEERVDGSGEPPAFCTALTDAQQIQGILDALLSEVEVGKVSTYPGPDEVEAALEAVQELLEAGNETVPPEVADAWYLVTEGFAQTGIFGQGGYDLRDAPQADVQAFVDGVDTPPVDDHEEIAAQDALAAWFVANCGGAIEAEPSFTG